MKNSLKIFKLNVNSVNIWNTFQNEGGRFFRDSFIEKNEWMDMKILECMREGGLYRPFIYLVWSMICPHFRGTIERHIYKSTIKRTLLTFPLAMHFRKNGSSLEFKMTRKYSYQPII